MTACPTLSLSTKTAVFCDFNIPVLFLQISAALHLQQIFMFKTNWFGYAGKRCHSEGAGTDRLLDHATHYENHMSMSGIA
jgi:hypothetical protein